jgi:hypothetical protein
LRRRFTVGRKTISEIGQLVEHLLHLVRVDNRRVGLRFVGANGRLEELQNIFQTARLLAFLRKIVTILVNIRNFGFEELYQGTALGRVLEHMKNTLTYVSFSDLALNSYREGIGGAIGPFIEVLRIPKFGTLR